MIFPRSRQALHRYNKRKTVAILVTFAVLWVGLKLLPGDRFLGRWEQSDPTPSEAFRNRWSGVDVQSVAVVEKVLPDSLPPGEPVALGRLLVRTLDGHPFMLLEGSGTGGVIASPGDTISVTGTYRWTTAGGMVLSAAAPAS